MSTKWKATESTITVDDTALNYVAPVKTTSQRLSNLPIASTARKSHLLRLPGEIRNSIYEYALTSSTGLVIKEGRDGIDKLAQEISSSIQIPGNQLQHTNRQLRHETADLEVRFNNIMVPGTKTRSSVEQCIDFLETLPSSQHQYFRIITLKNSEGYARNRVEWSEHVPALYQFCGKHPQVIIRAHLPNKLIRSNSTMMFPMVLKALINARGTSEFIERISDDVSLRTHFLFNPRSPIFARGAFATGAIAQAPLNFRLLPQDDQFDETAFRVACSHYPILINQVLPYIWTLPPAGPSPTLSPAERGLDAWVEIAKGLYKDGF
jgi:hypothetical protein